MLLRRWGALVLDNLLISAALGLALNLSGVSQPFLANVLWIVLFVLYRGGAHARWGATLGKRLTGLRVAVAQSEEGQEADRPSLGAAALRELPILLSMVFGVVAPLERLSPQVISTADLPRLVLLALAILAWLYPMVQGWWILFHQPWRVLHDRLAGTRVIRAKAIVHPVFGLQDD